MPIPRIAIVGAGPAGLMLARLLHVSGIPSTVFERDKSANERSVLGGSLDIHEGSGQEAMRKAGLWNQFSSLARWDSQAYKISDSDGKLWVDVKGLDLGRPEIDRPDLYKVLYESIPEEYFCWGHKLKFIDDDRTLHFEGGKDSQGGFDLIVGADGVWSKVRPYVSCIPPFYAGVQGFELWLRNSDIDFPELSAMVGDGAHFAIGNGDGKFLAMLRDGKRDIHTWFWIRKPELWSKEQGLENADGTTIKALLRKEFSHFAPEIMDLIEACDDCVTPRKLYMIHVGTRWLPKKSLTLVGDAAHAMSIFAGEGVNVSLHDSLSLSRAITANPGNIAEAIKHYEQEMFPRAEASQQVAWESLQIRFEPGGNKKLMDRFAEYVEFLNSGKGKPDEEHTAGPHHDGIWGN